MQVWNGSDKVFWRYRADMILFTDGRTDGWADRRTNNVKPVNPSFQLRWSGGYNNQHRQEHSKCVKWFVFIWNCFLQPSHRSTACKSKLTLKPDVTTTAVTWVLPQIPLPVLFRVDRYTVLAWWQSNCKWGVRLTPGTLLSTVGSRAPLRSIAKSIVVCVWHIKHHFQ